MKLRLLYLFLLSNIIFLQAQTLDQAKTWFLKGEYKKALPAFHGEFAKKPKDASINLWYGACLLKTGETKAALPRLQYARKQKIPNADLYLASYYMTVFAPDTSLMYLDEYLKRRNISPAKRDEAVLLRDTVQAYYDMLQRVEDVCFIDSVIVPRQAIYKTISLTKEAGSIIPMKSVFPNNTEESGLAYFPERNDRVYYAENVSGKKLNIFARHRLLSGWDKPEQLPETVNGPSNDCNPFFLQDGMTLYFASDGPGSMGGFDIFITRLNPATNTFLLPDRLNMPFNSTANEYFLIIDEFKNRGYLATDRNTKKGYVAIYTFIPSPVKVLLKDKSIPELQDFARIHSIRATWAGKNIDSLMQQPNVPVSTVTETSSEPDMIFRINDSISYTNVSDFRSEAARKTYINYRSDMKKLSDGNKQLEEKRLQYLEANSADKNKLGAEILKLEKELPYLSEKIHELEITIRNLEIKELSK